VFLVNLLTASPFNRFLCVSDCNSSIDRVELIELSDASQFERVISGEGVSEDDRLKTIIHWVNKDTHGRERFASKLFKLVRVTNLSDEYFSSLVDSSESWSSSAWFLKFLAGAVRSFHKRDKMDAERIEDRKEVSLLSVFIRHAMSVR